MNNDFFHLHGAKLVANGYDIVPIKHGGKAPVITGWQLRDFSVDVDNPRKWASGAGVGIKTKKTPAVDIDVLDEDLADQMENFIVDLVGGVPVRFGSRPKRLLVYASDEPFKKMTSNKYVDKEGTKHQIEILGDGQQFVAYHIHPSTKQPYEWDYGSPLEVPANELHTLTKVQGQEIIDQFHKVVEKDRPDWEVNTKASKPKTTTTVSHHVAGITERSDIEAALKHIPADIDYDSWIKIGMAINSENQSWGFDVWADWSSGELTNSDVAKYHNDTELQKKWDSFHGGNTTIGTLFFLANEYKDAKPVIEFHDGDLLADFVSSFSVSNEDMAQISDPEWLYDNLLIKGHVVLIVAEANGGKTTICVHIAGELALQGNKVIYVNADVSGSDAKKYHQHANDHKYSLLLPDFQIGAGMNSVVEKLTKINASSTDLSNTVFFFDTLKKMTDVLSKKDNKDLMATLRGLSAKGATVVCLAHTNKYKVDDKPIYEGTVDLRNDSDELIYLTPLKNSDGTMTVSTTVDKCRGDFEGGLTFTISSDRKVSLADRYVDTITERNHLEQLKKDQKIIDEILTAIGKGLHRRNEIAPLVSSARDRTVQVLTRYSNDKWRVEVDKRDNNAYSYYLV